MTQNNQLNQRGIAILLVLLVIMVVIVVANVTMMVVLSHTRLSLHQVRRVGAYYATLGGINYAREMLRIEEGSPGNGWGPGNYTICDSGCDVNDTDMDFQIAINIGNKIIDSDASINNTYPINVTTNYTYTTPY